MIKNQNSKVYDLEERTFEFAKRVRAFVKKLCKTIGNIEDGKQLSKTLIKSLEKKHLNP